MPVAERNLTRWIILDPHARGLFRDWPAVASEAVGALRTDTGRHPNDARANQLVGELAVSSEQFRQWWAGHRVATASAGSVRLSHTIAPIGGITKLPAFVTLLGANKLNIAVLADASLNDQEAVQKLRAAGKLANAGIVLISEVVGRDEADVEDILDTGFYLKLVNGAYASQLGDQPLKVADLPKGDRITHRIASVFRDRGINKGRLSHYSPAKHLLQKQNSLKIPTASLDRAELLIKKINAFL